MVTDFSATHASDPSLPPIEEDEVIAGKVQGGDSEVFGVLIERYEAKLLRYGRKFLADQDDIVDIVQEVFISAYQNIQSFDVSQKFSPWIYRIAHNALVNGLRKRSRNPLLFVDFDTFLAHPVYEDPNDKEREQEEIKRLIDTGLQKIAPKYREILILYYLEEMPYKDIAEVLQVPVGTVGIRVKRGKEALREVYKTMHVDYGA